MTDTSINRTTGARRLNAELAGIVLFALFFAIAPAFIYPVFLMKIMCYAILGISVNLLLGYLGLLSFGHAAFFGFAGYMFGYFARDLDLGTGLSFVLAVGCGTLMGCVFAAIAVRRTEFYFAMTTLALAQLVYFFCIQAPFTGGYDGLQGVPRGSVLGMSLRDNLSLYVFIFILFFGCLLLSFRIINSPFGELMKAIRENTPRVTSLGYNPVAYKFIAFVLSAFLASVGGVGIVLVLQIASLSNADWLMSGDGVLMSLVGGIGTLLGPVVGAFFIIGAHDGLAQIDISVVVVQGILFMVTVLMFRRGIVGEIARLWRRRR